ncbi:MAG: hypothetical protein QM687_01615 [Ferruginibacter sp.]
MKKHPIFAGALLCLSMTTIFSACSKDDDTPACKIITITPSAGTGTNITYNDDGSIHSISSGTSVKTFAYSGNTAIATEMNSGVFSSKVIITNNSSGLATNVRTENDMAGTSWSNLAFEYSGTQLIKQTSTNSSGGTPGVTTVAWTNGNPTEVSSGGSNIQTIDYYSDKRSQTGDYWDIAQTMQGYRIIRAKNPIKSILSGSTITNLSYGFNADGNITSLNATGGSTITYNYQLQCN